MNICLVHIGGEVPPYFKSCVQQIRRWSSGEVFVCVDDSGATDDLMRLAGKYSFHVVCASVTGQSAQDQFVNESWLNAYGQAGFWHYTMHRLYALEDMMRTMQLRNVIHIENDVLIYHDPAQMEWFPTRVAVNEVSDQYASFAFCMIPDWKELHIINQRMLSIMGEGKEVLEKRYGCMASEMLIAGEMLSRGELIRLPTLPQNTINAPTGVIYDGSAYGQFVSGTPHDPPGWAERGRYVGEAILDGRIEIDWSRDDTGRKYPYVLDVDHGGKHRLANLHIHSKKLEEWMS